MKLQPGCCRLTPDVVDWNDNTDVYCGICNENCLFLGKHRGPRGFVANAFVKSKKIEDYPEYYEFECANAKLDWHQHAEWLYSDQRNQRSYLIKNLIQREIDLVVTEKRMLKTVDINDYLSA